MFCVPLCERTFKGRASRLVPGIEKVIDRGFFRSAIELPGCSIYDLLSRDTSRIFFLAVVWWQKAENAF
jgi:hypothetical protein